MTKAELEVLVANLQAQLAALLATTVEEEPAEVPAPTPTPAVTGSYGEYNEHWCRTYQPIKPLLDAYENDGNRYHEMLVKRYDQESREKYGYTAREAVYLVKPETGFVNQDHETFFLRAYNGNRAKAHAIPKGSNFFKGRVFTAFRKQLWELPFPWVVGTGTDFVMGEEVPFAGTGTQDVADRARVLFENWWKKDGVLLWGWKNFLPQVRDIDSRYSSGVAEDWLRELYPWWRPDDGSPAEF